MNKIKEGQRALFSHANNLFHEKVFMFKDYDGMYWAKMEPDSKVANGYKYMKPIPDMGRKGVDEMEKVKEGQKALFSDDNEDFEEHELLFVGKDGVYWVKSVCDDYAAYGYKYMKPIHDIEYEPYSDQEIRGMMPVSVQSHDGKRIVTIDRCDDNFSDNFGLVGTDGPYWHSAKEIFRKFVHIDGRPFGKVKEHGK